MDDKPSILSRKEAWSLIWPALLLALVWSMGPAIPALLNGQLIGHGQTDLYPSVWGLWVFSNAQPNLLNETSLLGFPNGMGFAYSSPLKGWLAWPLIPIIGVPNTWNVLVLAARFCTVITSWMAARAWGLGRRGAFTAAAIYGCAPFFHGYAVEGIVEGTDGWTLALWAWALGRQRFVLSAIFLGLTAWSSWYLGICACLLTVLSSWTDRRRLWSLAGLGLVFPQWLAFSEAFPNREPLSSELRSQMGASLQIPSPGYKPGLQWSAMTAWVGGLTLVAALQSRKRWLWLVPIPAILSLGGGPWYDLPILSDIRFPYRWHAATLALLALCAGATADRDRLGWFWAPLIIIEGILTSPVEPILPGSDPSVPAIYTQVDAPIIEVPGPVTKPPGEINPSRPRAKYLLYFQTLHGQASPWVPDFNSVGVSHSNEELLAFRSQDPVEDLEWSPIGADALNTLRTLGVRYLMIQRCAFRTDCAASGRARQIQLQLETMGATVQSDDGERCLMRID